MGVKVVRALLAASHLAIAASAVFEGSASPRQRQLRLRRAHQPVSLLASAADRHSIAPPPLAVGTAAGDAAQLAFMVSQKDDPQEVERLEQMVTDLIKEQKQAKKGDKEKATPVGPSIRYIKTIIDDTMLPNREKAHQNDQDALDSAARALESCQEHRSQYLSRASSAKASYKSASRRHVNCRMGESGEWMEHNDRCRPENMEVKRLQTQATCMKVAEVKASCEYSDYTKITEAEMECDRAKESERAAHELCDETKYRYEGVKSQCDALQSQMDEAACQHAVRMKEACDEGNNCYEAKLEAFRSTQDRVKRDEVTRKAEWRALKRMQCLVASFENGQVTDAEVDACKAKTHYPPSINYPAESFMDECTVPDKYPGRAAYKEAEFGNLPPQAKGKPDAGSCYAMGL